MTFHDGENLVTPLIVNQIRLNALAVSAALIAATLSARNAVSIGGYGTMCDTLKCSTISLNSTSKMYTTLGPSEVTCRWL